MEAFYQAQTKLSKTLLHPFSNWLDKASEVIIAPDGALHQINFELLAPPREKPGLKFWIETQKIRIVPAGRLLAR